MYFNLILLYYIQIIQYIIIHNFEIKYLYIPLQNRSQNLFITVPIKIIKKTIINFFILYYLYNKYSE